MRILDVYYNETKAGQLTELLPGRGYRFDYDEAYAQSGMPSVAMALPKRGKSFFSESLFPFFANIIPEGYLKARTCRRYKIDEEDEFGLLSAMDDADFIGAVSVRNARHED